MSLFLSRSLVFLCSGVLGDGFLSGISSFADFGVSGSIVFLLGLDSVDFDSAIPFVSAFTSLTLVPLFF